MKNFILLITVLIFTACAPEQKLPKQYSIEQFYKNIRFGGGNFSNDETRLLISSDASGIFNAYEIKIADSIPGNQHT